MPAFLLALVALTGCALGAAAPPPGDAARIDVTRHADRYDLVGVYTGPVSDGLAYSLEVMREGSGGRSRSSQGGAVRGDTLSSSSVNVAPGDRVEATLVVRDGDEVVAEARIDEVVGG